jgi:hypothetical protein
VFALAATDGEKKGIAIVNHKNEPVTVNVCAAGAENHKIFAVDEEHDFAEIEGDLSALTVPANAIFYIEA